MNIEQVIDILVSGGGLALALTYVTGGLIVNLHLAQYGITQYQVLKVKYLVVGLTYFTNFAAIILLSGIPAFFLIVASPLLQRATLIVSLLSSVSLFWLWAQSKRIGKQLFNWQVWIAWIAMGALSSVFPFMVSIRLALVLWFGSSVDYELGLLAGLGFITGVLSFVGQIYYYSRHLYGKPNVILGAVDPIGMGIPMTVQLTGERDEISLLSQIGVPMINRQTTENVILFDETSTHYIIGVSDNEKGFQAVEITKDIVKAIRYGSPEHVSHDEASQWEFSSLPQID